MGRRLLAFPGALAPLHEAAPAAPGGSTRFAGRLGGRESVRLRRGVVPEAGLLAARTLIARATKECVADARSVRGICDIYRMTNARILTDRLAELLRREQASMADFLVALADFDRRRAWLELGNSSLFYFLHRSEEHTSEL